MSHKESKLSFIEASKQILTQPHHWSALKNPLSLFRVQKLAEIVEPIPSKSNSKLNQFQIDAIPFATESDTGIINETSFFEQNSNIKAGPKSSFLPSNMDSLFSSNANTFQTPQEIIANSLKGIKYDPQAKINIEAIVQNVQKPENSTSNILPFTRKK